MQKEKSKEAIKAKENKENFPLDNFPNDDFESEEMMLIRYYLDQQETMEYFYD